MRGRERVRDRGMKGDDEARRKSWPWEIDEVGK